MANFHVHTIPGVAWPPVPRGEVSQMWAMFSSWNAASGCRRPPLSRDRLGTGPGPADRTRQHVPYYQEVFSGAGIDPESIRTLEDFRRIPVLQRRTYQDQFERFQAQALPPGMKATNRLRTSGTSGMPIEVWQTNLVNLWWFAFHLRPGLV